MRLPELNIFYFDFILGLNAFAARSPFTSIFCTSFTAELYIADFWYLTLLPASEPSFAGGFWTFLCCLVDLTLDLPNTLIIILSNKSVVQFLSNQRSFVV